MSESQENAGLAGEVADAQESTRGQFLRNSALAGGALMSMGALSAVGADVAEAEPGSYPVPKSSLHLPKVYIASASGFDVQEAYWYNKIFLPWVSKYCHFLDPWGGSTPKGPQPDWYKGGHFDELLIRKSVATLAIVNGPVVDSGTASEIGFSYALGHPIFALRQDFRNISDEDAPINLQTYYWIANSGNNSGSYRKQERYATTLPELGKILKKGLSGL